MPEYVPIRKPGHSLVATTSAAVTGGQLVFVSGSGTVAPTTGATDAWLGVAAYDAATNETVTIHTSGVQELTASAAITAGSIVAAAAGGAVAPIGTGTFGQAVGVALTTAAGGAKVRVKFNR